MGRGAIRFYLPLDEQLENDFFAQSVIVTKGEDERERVIQKIQNILDNEYPQLTGRAYAMELGPPVGWPVQFRVSGPDQEKVQEYAHQVAGIMAAKKNSELIPMCHPLLLTKVDISFEMEEAALHIRSEVRCHGETGVEMEALTAVSVAALTVYDMCKAVQRDMRIDGIRLLYKEGGKSGVYEAEE